MCKNSIDKSLRLAAISSVIVATLAAVPAVASDSSNNRSFTLAGRQLLLIERMTNSALLTALRIDAAPKLRAIHWSRDRFDRMQNDLRQGNPNLGLDPTARPEILETLDYADLRWRQYDAIFGKIVKSGKVSEAQISALTASHTNTAEALGQMVNSYEYFVYGGRNHSILSTTINGTGQLRASTQLVLRRLMLTVYHNYAELERELLAQATEDFDQMINGLIHGNPELRLLPAATLEIKDELTKVQLMWKEVRPILDAAAAGQAVSKKQIATVAKYANNMAVPLTMALIMYLSV